ncbi:MAG: CotH kinase family protein [Promethearchaeota archaeon]
MKPKRKFESRKPKHQRKKEVLIILFIGMILISGIYIYTYVIYYPVYSGRYPRINIKCENEPNYDNYVDCVFELIFKGDSESVEPLNAKMKIRGSGTGWNEFSPKKGYRLSLNEPKSLLGMREDDDWLLLDMYSDYPRMRFKLAFELYQTLTPSDPTTFAPESEYVNLFINGDYQGLYLLTERNDRKLYGLDDAQNNIYSSLIFQAKGHIFFKTYDPIMWDQDWPNDYEGIYIMDPILSELIPFVGNSSDEEFFDPEKGIYSKFDKLNLIDFYIFNFFILHDDFWDKNYFLVRNTYPNKFFLVPWDYDRCFGEYAWNNFDPDRNDEVEIRELNYLFNRLLGNNEYRNSVKERWFNLRITIWSEQNIVDMLEDIYEEVKDILEIETNKWNPGDMQSHWKNNVDESVKRLFTWIPERLDFCDSYFEKF